MRKGADRSINNQNHFLAIIFVLCSKTLHHLCKGSTYIKHTYIRLRLFFFATFDLFAAVFDKTCTKALSCWLGFSLGWKNAQYFSW